MEDLIYLPSSNIHTQKTHHVTPSHSMVSARPPYKHHSCHAPCEAERSVYATSEFFQASSCWRGKSCSCEQFSKEFSAQSYTALEQAGWQACAISSVVQEAAGGNFRVMGSFPLTPAAPIQLFESEQPIQDQLGQGLGSSMNAGSCFHTPPWPARK